MFFVKCNYPLKFKNSDFIGSFHSHHMVKAKINIKINIKIVNNHLHISRDLTKLA